MKTIVFSTFVLLAVLNGIHGQPTDGEPKQICTPGTRTEVDCNTCTCSQDGTALGCTRMACPQIPAEFLNPDGSLKLPHQSNPLIRLRRSEADGQPTDGEPKQICTPGTRTKVDCNTCTCSQDGTALGCTRMACPKIPAEFLNPDGSLKLPHQSNPLLRVRRSEADGQPTDGEPKQICTPGSQTKVDCNTCTCSQDGTALGCTRMACPEIPAAEFLNPDGSLKLPHQSNPLLRLGRSVKICEPGTTRTWECNTCRCSPDGTGEICTRRLCPNLARTRRDREFRCTPNESYMEDCNHCRCSPDGRTAACTLKACLPSLTPTNPLLRTKRDQICTPGTTRMNDCNTCRCNSDGTAEACTRKGCLPRQRRDVPLRCVPNSNFMDDCNHCFCSSDGRSAGCTMMACPSQNILQISPPKDDQ